MTTVSVSFINVGRGRACWTQDVGADNGVPTIDGLLRAIKKRKALGSRGVEVTYDDDGEQMGDIFAGDRHVGSWHVATSNPSEVPA